MEAKDTVAENKALVMRQAEISFRAGYEQGFDDCIKSTHENDFSGGKRAGIKEVVEWIKRNRKEITSYWEADLVETYIPDDLWEAKLKEWGIDGNTET